MAFWDTVMDEPGDVPYGRRLIPIIVDDVATKDPERLCFSIPQSQVRSHDFRDISFHTFANAINKTAHFIHKEIGRSSMFETVMYMGFPDIRHFIALVALMKTGHKVLFSSHHNSVAAHVDLIKRTDCTILLHTAGFPVSGILENCRMESLCMPELDYLLDGSAICEEFPYKKTFEEAKHHPCMVVHTTETAGLPKPVIWTHWTLVTADSHHLVPALEGRPTIWGGIFNSARRSFSALPIFHAAGIVLSINKACFNRSVAVLGPPGTITANIFEEVLDNADFDAANCTTTTLEEIATRSDILPKLQRLRFITYLGGPLSETAGSMISRYVRLYSIVISAETNVLVQHATDVEDWQYVCLNPDYNRMEMRAAGELHELCLTRDTNGIEFQGVFKNFPRLNEYSMSDLYANHPDKAYHWKPQCRKDDMIIFENGRKFNPIIHERLIASHTAIKCCILAGTGRKMPVAIVELQSQYDSEEDSTRQKLLAELTPKIDEANKHTAANCQLSKDFIMFARKEKPFAITPEGTVQRKITIRLYTPEIDQFYLSLGEGRGLSA